MTTKTTNDSTESCDAGLVD